ncbi:MAG: hypothetical protein ACE5F9_07165 [Phycisphaerae bacterium]
MADGIDHAGFRRNIVQPLRALGRTLRRYVVVEGLCQCAALFLAVAAGHLMLDRLLRLEWGPRAACLMIVVGFAGYQVWMRLIRPLLAPIGVEAVAAVVERRDPTLRDQLISAVSFSMADRINPHRDSPALVAALIDRVADRARALPLGDVLRRGRHRRHLALGIGAVGAVILATLTAGDTLGVYVARDLMLRDVAWPSRMHITLEGFKGRRLRWPVGDEWTLVATARDAVPDGLSAEFRSASGEHTTRDMVRRGRNQFLLDYGPVMRSMQVRLLIQRFGVDEATDWYRVEAVERPSIQWLGVEVTPPAYSGRAVFRFPAGQTAGDILRGSSVRLTATLSKPVERASLRCGGVAVAEVSLESDRRLSAAFVPVRTGTYYFDLVDAEGLADLRPVTCALRLVDDAPPRVRLALPGAGELVLANAILSLDVAAEDDLGLRSLKVVYRALRADEGAAVVEAARGRGPLPLFVPKQTKYAEMSPWPLLPLTLTAGDRLTVQVRAADFQPIEPSPASASASRPSETPIPANVGVSAAYTLSVVTREQLLADLGRREHEWRREFEQIIKTQEQLNRRMMDLRDEVASGGASVEATVQYGRESRTQRQQAARIKTVRTQFEQVLAEHRTNQIATPAVRRRLGAGVIVPMRRLIGADIPEAADLAERLRLRFDAEVADELERKQTALVQSMHEILAHMLKWEGYNEAVVLLQDIVRLQEDINRQTQGRLEQEIDKLFGDTPTSQPEDRP